MTGIKQKFDEYELLFTPILLIISILLIYYFIPQILYIENYIELFIVPTILGIILGVVFSYFLDKYWKRIDVDTISSFIRLPTLILILFSALSTLLITTDPFLAFSCLGVGLGALLSVICFTSLVTYYRSYNKKKVTRVDD